MFRMVIIGTAHMHANEIALYIDRNPEAELVGVADLVPETEEKTKARYTRNWNRQNIVNAFHAKAYDDYEQMLEEEKPDLAFVLCENDRKKEAAFSCIRHKVPFCLEKPMAMTYEEAKEIAEAAKEAGIEAMVNWPVIWRPYVNQLIYLLDKKIVGSPVRMEYANGHTGPLGKGARHRGVAEAADEMSDEERSSTWWYQEKHGGGVFLDILCYGCLYTRWILGAEWESIMAVGANLDTPYSDCADNAAAIVRFPKQISTFSGTWTTPNQYMMTGPAVFCTDGVIYCSKDAQGNPCVRGMDIYGKDIPLEPWKQEEKYTDMICNFIHHRRTGEAMHLPSDIGVNVEILALLSASIRSAKEHREIGVSEL